MDIDFTKQSRLGRFGARWACLATCYLNIAEMEKGERLTVQELTQSIGLWALTESVLICNYKDHGRIGDEIPGWTAEADPEMHYYVTDNKRALNDTMIALGVDNLTHKYEILKLNIGHFVLRIDGDKVINPDPSLSGEIVETRPIN